MRRGRRVLAIVLLVVLLAAIAGVVAVRSLLSPQRFTAMLRDQVNAMGLQMQLAAPASPSLWPHLAIRLNGLGLRRNGTHEPMLTADEAFLVVPWSGLLRGEARIEKLQIHAVQIDLGQVQPWLAGLDRDNAGSTAKLPTIEAGVHVDDATVLKGSTLLLRSLSLDTGTLRPGQNFSLAMQARDADNRPLELRIDSVPEQHGAVVSLDPLELYLAAGAPPSLRLKGHLRWSGGAQVTASMQGILALEHGDYTSRIETQRTSDGETRLQLVVDGAATHMNLSLAPDDAWHWWQRISAQDGSTLALPPVLGSVRADELDLGAVKIRGLLIESGAPAAAGSSAAAAAASVASP